MWWNWLKIKKIINSILQYGHVFRKDYLVVFTASQFPYVILCTNLMTVQITRGKARHTCKELIRRIMTFDYEKLLLLKSPHVKWHQILRSLGKKQNKPGTSYMPGTFWDKVINFTDEPVFQCDVPPIKDTSLDDDDNDDCK